MRQASSHDFISAIFGFLGKFGMDIGEPKMFWSKKKSLKKSWSKKKIGRKIFWAKKNLVDIFFIEIFDEFFSINFFFDRKIFLIEQNFIENVDEKNFDQKLFSTNKKIRQNFRPKVFGFFSMKIISPFFLVIYSDPKFPQDSKNHT